MIIDLKNKQGLVTGIANEYSIAYGCAEQFRGANAELATTFLNAKAEPFMRPLALQLKSPLILPCDVQKEEEIIALFAAIEKNGGNWISCCIRWLLPPKMTWRANWLILLRRDSWRRWISPVIP